MKSEISCSKCCAQLSALAWSNHQRLHHIWMRSEYDCAVCPFRSRSLSFFLTHALLEGHSLPPSRQHQLLPSFFQGLRTELRADEDSHLPLPTSAPPIHSESQFPQGLNKKGCPTPDSSTTLARPCEAEKRVEESLDDEPEVIEERTTPPDISLFYAEPECLQLADSSSEDEEEDVKQLSLVCKKCGSNIEYTNSLLVQHVQSCSSIRSFACAACGYLASRLRAVTVVGHMRERGGMCSVSLVELVDKERNEAAVRAALKTCFPSATLAWPGLAL